MFRLISLFCLIFRVSCLCGAPLTPSFYCGGACSLILGDNIVFFKVFVNLEFFQNFLALYKYKKGGNYKY